MRADRARLRGRGGRAHLGRPVTQLTAAAWRASVTSALVMGWENIG